MENKIERLAELETIHASLMSQPRLSDETGPKVQWVWVYGKEIATILEIPCEANSSPL